jgi:Tfp pilus assembly protein PilO
VQIDGGYHEVGRFLAEVGNLSRIVQVRDLRLVTGTGANTDEDGRVVSASFIAEAYASKDVAPQPAQVAAAQ